MARSLTSRQRDAGRRKLAARRGTSPANITDADISQALDTGSLSYSDCTPSSSGSSSSYSGGSSDSGGSYSSSDSGGSSGGGGGGGDC